MSVVKKVLWAIFVGIAGLFSGMMVERGLKTVYDPNKTEDAKSEDGPEEATEAATETNCESSVAESEVEKSSDDESKSNEE